MLDGKKTYVVMIGGLLTVVGTFFTGDATLAESINAALLFLGLGGLRAGIASSK